ncbi:MAG: chromosome segregation protein SMC [Thermoplasmata archaeon]
MELENFKSFGRHLRLPLLQGYTAVTGPNGSGKSNLSDAVLFVLGPKSSRVIRAGRLTDLVYNGGEKGKPAKYCRVSLVFDNSDRIIPLDNDEVKLTRYVGLSTSVEGGYNSYFYINGRKATLTAFDTLLAHAKISAEGYNIVQQGDVGKIVEMSPVERRGVLEEIAGISKFDQDIRTAEEQKHAVEENLGRIEIILEEIGRQLRQLERDRQAALRYRELKEELERARSQQARKEVHVLQQQLTSTQRQVGKYQAERVKLREERARLQHALGEAEEGLRQLEDEVVQMGGEEFKELKEKLDALRIERARAQDGIEREGDEAKVFRAEALTVKKELERISNQKGDLKAAQREARKTAEDLETSMRSKDDEIADLEKRASQSDSRILELQKALVSLDRELEASAERQKTLILEREKLSHRLESLNEQIDQIEEDRKGREFEVQDADWQLKDAMSMSKTASKELRRLRKRYAELEIEERELTKQSSELDSAIRNLSRDYSQLKAEAEAADRVMRGYNRAVRAILEARDTGVLEGIRGTVAELARVEPEHEVALNVAAGARMQAIVVDDDAVASSAIEHLKSKKLGRAIFLPLNKMLPGRPRGRALLAVKEAIGFAIDLVSFEDEYRNAFWYVFGATVVVKNLAHARRLMGGVRLVTLDGQLVEASGAMVGGQVGEALLRFGQVAEGRLVDVGKKLKKASEELKKVNDRLRGLRDETGQLERGIKEHQAEEDRRQSKGEVLRGRVKELKERLSGAVDALQQLKERKEEALRELESLEPRLKEVERGLERLRQRREAKRVELAETTPQRIARKLREHQAEKLSVSERLNDVRARRETLESQIALQRERSGELTERLAQIEKRSSRGEKMKRDLTERLSEVEEELLGMQKMEERLLAEMKGVRERRDRGFRGKTRTEARLEKVGSKLETTEDFLISLESQTASLREKLTEAESHVRDADVEEELPSLEDIRAAISRCEKGLDSIGAVNLRALEDYESQQARSDQLGGELSRLRKERKNLLRLVGELETRKEEGLLRVFRAVRDNFTEIFPHLTEGGEAMLLLEDEENPLEGGLIIKARPPKKRFLRLEALSGGEKSLVSMAFIFAIQEFDPSPFYLLDEVDQNLDAVNAERMARMIRTNSASAQFVQISLRKVSLKEADHIIGITMSKRGISEVVMKVNLDDVVEEVPRAEAMT